MSNFTFLSKFHAMSIILARRKVISVVWRTKGKYKKKMKKYYSKKKYLRR